MTVRYNGEVSGHDELSTDQEVVVQALAHKEAFSEIIARYEQKLRRYILRLGVHTSDDQNDVLQNIFLKVYRNLNSYDADLPFSSWIYRIARNEAISWYRQRSVRPEGHAVAEPEEVLGLMAEATESPEVAYDTVQTAEVVLAALQAIDVKYREVLILRFFEHKEYEEISDILQIPIGSVGTLLHRGKQQLARELKPEMARINIDIS